MLTAPAILMQSRNWVCRRGKVPADPYGRTEIPREDGFITWKDPSFWVSFSQAVAGYEKKRSKISGIGYVVSRDPSRRADQQIVGIDLDCCRDPTSGWASPKVLDTLQKLDSPTSVSISGCGYRVFAIGRLPDYLPQVVGHAPDDLTPEAKQHIRERKPDCAAFNGIEIYAGGPRHLSVTGQWLPEYPPEMAKRTPQRLFTTRGMDRTRGWTGAGV